MQQYNYLLDNEFLTKLDAKRDRKVYAKIIALTFQEEPIELIEGQVTQGSISIDGSSAVRRTCSLSLIAKELNINDYYWNIKTKFKLEIGLENLIDNKYPDIVWFPQGVFAITAFNTSQNVNSYTVSISGKDKMCFLNGDLGGNLPASIDFGVEEYYDKNSQTTTYTPIPIKKIIREAVHTYAREPYYNIVINDLDDAAVELLEYRGDTPLYLTRYELWDQFDNATLDGSTLVRFADDNSENPKYFAIEDLTLPEQGGFYDPRIELAPEAQAITPSRLVFKNDKMNRVYTVAKVEYGQTAGYRKTDLTYAGDLISSIGESLTSILDKIVKMLGEYEYFYNLEGQFVFQKKQTYIQTSWNNITKIEDEEYVESAAHSSAVIYRFEDSNLITSFQNSPNLTNMRNDYSIWGQRESVSGAKISIHYRYAIDEKPSYYKTFAGKEFFSSAEKLEEKKQSERQKALERFKYKVNSFTKQYNINEKLALPEELKDEEGNRIGWGPGWWDIRDWYNYYELLVKSAPNGSIKWYSQRDTTGYVVIKTIPGYETNTYRNFACWLLVDNGDGTFEMLGRGYPSTSQRECTYYESSLVNGVVVTKTTTPVIKELFIPPFYNTDDKLTYLEIIKQKVEGEGKQVYIYNPKFPSMDVLTEEEMALFEEEWAEQVKSLQYACVDWREIIYQMALDYYQHNEEDDFLPAVGLNNSEYYPTGITGYEQYYIDLQSFWRQLYNPSPDPEYSQYQGKAVNDKFQALIAGTNSNTELYIKGQYKEISNLSAVKSSDVYALKHISYTFTYTDDNDVTQSIPIDRYELVPWEDAIEINYYSSFTIAANDDKKSNTYYISKGNNTYEAIYESVKDQIQKSEIFIYENGAYVRLIESQYAQDQDANNILGFYQYVNDGIEYGVFTDVELKDLYFYDDWYNKYLYQSRYDIEGQPITTALSVKYAIDYYGQYYDYIVDTDSNNLYWTLDLVNAPASLNFWFDFLDPSDPEAPDIQSLGQFSVKSVGDRTKVVNDTSVSAIYFREVPDVIFVKPTDYSGDTKEWTGYTTIYMQGTVESLFNISSQGKSAQDRLDELLYNHSYCIESVTIQSIPIYYLEPNTRIFVRDDQSGINGEYIVSKMTIPLAYNGTMSITATKAPERIY